MKCPVFIMGLLANRGSVEDADFGCIQEECAWWDGRHSQCVIFTIGEILYAKALKAKVKEYGF